jgi:hypothetical protein
MIATTTFPSLVAKCVDAAVVRAASHPHLGHVSYVLGLEAARPTSSSRMSEQLLS